MLMMCEYNKTQNKLDLLPWSSPPCPTSPFPRKDIMAVPDISLAPNDYTPSPINSKSIANPQDLNRSNKHQYPQDSRLRFYQIVQSNANHNSPKVHHNVSHNTSNHRQSSLQNTLTGNENKNFIFTGPKKNSTRCIDNSLKQSCHRQDEQKENFQELYAPSKNPYSNFKCTQNNCNSDNGITKLMALIKRQNQQLESLKQQINTLVANKDKYRDNITTDDQTDNEIKSLKSIQIQKEKCDGEMKNIFTDKVSIGVMTSFEFTIRNNRNKLDIEDASGKNPPSLDAMCDGESLNSLNGPLEKIIEKSECQVSEPTDEQINNCDEKILENPVKGPDNYIDNDVNESVKVTSTVGWTFYNNILCHVNEILHNSNESNQSRAQGDYVRKSNREQIKVFESAFPDMKNIITSNITDKLIAIDSSYYPTVNYQATNVIQSSNSMTDIDASIHMKALALKYLGREYATLDNLSEWQMSMNELVNKSHPVLDRIFESNTSISMTNCLNKYKLTNHPAAITNERMNSDKQNILDVSILKRQPKLL